MNPSIQKLSLKTKNILRGTILTLSIIYILVFLSYTILQMTTIKDSFHIWADLFDSRITQIEQMIDTQDPKTPYQNYFKIGLDGMVLESSSSLFENMQLNKSGLFQKIYELNPNEIRIIFFPDIIDGIQRVHFAKRYTDYYVVYSFDPNNFFPDFTVQNTELLLNVDGIIWYATDPQYIGNAKYNNFLSINNWRFSISFIDNATALADSKIIVVEDVTFQFYFFIFVAMGMGLLFYWFNRNIKKLYADFNELNTDQTTMGKYINTVTQHLTTQNAIFDDHQDSAKITHEDVNENAEFNLKFAENINYKNLIEQFIKKVFDLLSELRISNKKLEKRLGQSIDAISKIGELRDMYTAGHQKRVQQLAIAIAKELGLSKDKILNISYGAMIHDIGKIYIPSEILNKPGKLSPLEYQILQTHPEKGYEVIAQIDFPSQISAMILQHHENLDGTGYPKGLMGDQIILESRILSVADVVEAMSSHRPYRPALGVDAALAYITENRGTKFDPAVVDVCVKLFTMDHFQFFA